MKKLITYHLTILLSLITYLFSLLRNRINVVGIRWFNRIVAVIFMAISGFGLFAGLSDILK